MSRIPPYRDLLYWDSSVPALTRDSAVPGGACAAAVPAEGGQREPTRGRGVTDPAHAPGPGLRRGAFLLRCASLLRLSSTLRLLHCASLLLRLFRCASSLRLFTVSLQAAASACCLRASLAAHHWRLS
eukprot:1950229-Rhodomonas_salina.1